MNFGQAIEELKNGKKVAREGWNGKGMWIVLMEGMKLPSYSDQTGVKKVNDRTAKLIGENTPLETLPYIAMWTADKKWLPGWLASQTDMLSEDWMIVDDQPIIPTNQKDWVWFNTSSNRLTIEGNPPVIEIIKGMEKIFNGRYGLKIDFFERGKEWLEVWLTE